MNDRSNEALLARRAKAEAATPGPWNVLAPDVIFVCGQGKDEYLFENPQEISTSLSPEQNLANARFIAANAPGTVIEDINEILRLRSLNEMHEEYIANLELEAASTDNKIDGLALLLGIMPDTGNRRIIGIIKDEILRLQAKAVRLEREAEWLADHCREFCESYGYCGECPMFSGWLKRDQEDCGETVGYRGDKHTANWREAARKAVEGKA